MRWQGMKSRLLVVVVQLNESCTWRHGGGESRADPHMDWRGGREWHSVAPAQRAGLFLTDWRLRLERHTRGTGRELRVTDSKPGVSVSLCGEWVGVRVWRTAVWEVCCHLRSETRGAACSVTRIRDLSLLLLLVVVEEAFMVDVVRATCDVVMASVCRTQEPRVETRKTGRQHGAISVQWFKVLQQWSLEVSSIRTTK